MRVSITLVDLMLTAALALGELLTQLPDLRPTHTPKEHIETQQLSRKVELPRVPSEQTATVTIGVAQA